MKTPKPEILMLRYRRRVRYGTSTGLLTGLLVGMLSLMLFAALEWRQVIDYPRYVSDYLIVHDTFSFLSFGDKPTAARDINGRLVPWAALWTKEKLEWYMLTIGNTDHSLDDKLLYFGYYPQTPNPRAWIYENQALPPVYHEGPLSWLVRPVACFFLPLFLFWIAAKIRQIGFIAKFRNRIRVGGPYILTVDEYNRHTRGDGMVYHVSDREDR